MLCRLRRCNNGITSQAFPEAHKFIGSKTLVCFLVPINREHRKEDVTMLKKLFSRKNSYTTAIRRDIAEISTMSKQYEETHKQVLKNVETINALMGR